METKKVTEQLSKVVKFRQDFTESLKNIDWKGLYRASWDIQTQLMELLADVCEDDDMSKEIRKAAAVSAMKADALLILAEPTREGGDHIRSVESLQCKINSKEKEC